jgi:quercetin dioxygenase-like cupin family protein
MRISRPVSRLVSILALLLVWSAEALSEDYTDVRVEKLLFSTTAYNGQPLSYPAAKQPEVTVLMVTIPPGGLTGWHRHPVPVYAYVMEGEITIDLKSDGSHSFRKGDVILEVRDILHNGKNIGENDVKLLVFYTGASGVPNVVRQEP